MKKVKASRPYRKSKEGKIPKMKSREKQQKKREGGKVGRIEE